MDPLSTRPLRQVHKARILARTCVCSLKHAHTDNRSNPGAIATGLQKHTGGLKTPRERQKTVPQGAATSVLLAASPLLDKVGGRYFEDCNEAATVTRRPADYAGVAWYALDPSNAERLWDTALGLLPA
jgi:hypothetical protein